MFIIEFFDVFLSMTGTALCMPQQFP